MELRHGGGEKRDGGSGVDWNAVLGFVSLGFEREGCGGEGE